MPRACRASAADLFDKRRDRGISTTRVQSTKTSSFQSVRINLSECERMQSRESRRATPREGESSTDMSRTTVLPTSPSERANNRSTTEEISSAKHAIVAPRCGVALAPGEVRARTARMRARGSTDMTKGLLLGAACALVALMLVASGAPVLPVASGLAVGALAVWASGIWKTRSPR